MLYRQCYLWELCFKFATSKNCNDLSAYFKNLILKHLKGMVLNDRDITENAFRGRQVISEIIIAAYEVKLTFSLLYER